MNWGLHLTAASGLAACLTVAAPASAATFTYDLTGTITTAYTEPAWPGWTYVDLTDSVTGTGPHPGYTLSVGDVVEVAMALDNSVAFRQFEIGLQGMSDLSTVFFGASYSYFSGGMAVPTPSAFEWSEVAGTGGGFGFGGGFYGGSDSFSFDKVLVTAVITSMTDPSDQPVSFINLTERYAPYVGFYQSDLAPVPLPGGLLLISTALGGLAIVARRKRKATA